MKQKTLALTFILALLCSTVAVTQLISLIRANPYPGVNLVVTAGSQSEIYNVNAINLDFLVEYYYGICSFFYSLDGQMMKPVENTTVVSQVDYKVVRTTLQASCSPSNLTEGWHNVTFYVIASREFNFFESYREGEIMYSSTTAFRIDTVPPNISILGMRETTYASSVEIPLIFTVNEAISQIAYSLDGHRNVTLAGNTTLTEVTYGAHRIKLFATDDAGNTGVSDDIQFNVANPKFAPAALVVTSSSLLHIVGFGLLLYFKKRQHEAEYA
jgi:hypothetical protein